MKRYFETNKLIAAIAISAAVALPSLAMAKVSGQCGNCHTMHNSQDGAAMASTGVFGSTTPADDTANGSLLRYGCIGCHTGTNAAGAGPFVLDATAAPTTTSLAGGNFYWVNAGTDASGHNVIGLPSGNTEGTLTATPGAGGAANVPAPNALTCAGVTGCHGKRGVTDTDEFGAIAGGHHGSAGTSLTDTTKTYTSGHATDMSDAFRMLAGIKGIEDNDWEFGATAATKDGTTDHNQYYGVDRTAETEAAAGTISSLCAQCHGAFHNGAGSVSSTFSSPWVRHPTDFDMATATGSEYAFYNNGDGTNPANYSVIAPVATDTMTGADADLLSTVNVTSATADGSAIVTCISCHRAHGSPNADLLRWAYDGVNETHASVAGNNNTGCFICHTTKDDV